MFVTETDLKGYFPDFFLSTGTDDKRQGALDPETLGAIITAAEQRVAGMLEPGYITPTVAPIPTFVKYAMVLFTVDQLSKRRGQPDHAWKKDVEALLERMKAISEGTDTVEEESTDYFGTESELAENPLLFGDVGARGSY